MRRLFEMLIKYSSDFELNKFRMKKQMCDLTYCFDILDFNRKGFLVEYDFAYFLLKRNHEVSASQISSLFKIFC